jgi:hypothetical protein
VERWKLTVDNEERRDVSTDPNLTQYFAQSSARQ